MVNTEEMNNRTNVDNDDVREKIKNLIPMSRMANKNEYQGAIQFLCSESSSYMTGQNVIIDGGSSIICKLLLI